MYNNNNKDHQQNLSHSLEFVVKNIFLPIESLQFLETRPVRTQTQLQRTPTRRDLFCDKHVFPESFLANMFPRSDCASWKPRTYAHAVKLHKIISNKWRVFRHAHVFLAVETSYSSWIPPLSVLGSGHFCLLLWTDSLWPLNQFSSARETLCLLSSITKFPLALVANHERDVACCARTCVQRALVSLCATFLV